MTEIDKILGHREPSRFVYAPNYWQWFRHQQNHNLLPEEIRHCKTLTGLYKYLGVDIFSRNVYCDPERYWFGGLCKEHIKGFRASESESLSGRDKVYIRQYGSDRGSLDEKLTYIHNGSTLVQNKFIFADYLKDFELFRDFVAGREWVFSPEAFRMAGREVGDSGIVIAGEFFSPLKMLHLAMGPVNAVYFLMECRNQALELIRLHEEAILRSVEECVRNGVRVIMSMDNLDTLFHSPDLVEQFSSSYYSKASGICHKYGAKFFIHACGQQKDNLKLISSYGVDGLEGLVSPPLGDVMLYEAMDLTRNDFVITGGISAMETRDLKGREKIFSYVEELFRKMLPYKKRFIFSSSCNTAIDTSWQTIKDFRDAWLNFREMN